MKKGLKKSVIIAMAVMSMTTQMASAQSSTPLPTSDGFFVACISDSALNSVDALPMDGNKGIITFGLAARGGGNLDSARFYTAYNLDIALPYGLEAVKKDGEPAVSLPEDFSLYAKRIGLLSHSIAAATRGNGVVRVACSSNSNKDFRAASGDLFEMGVRVSSPFYKPGENLLRLSNQNLTVRANAQKYVPRDTVSAIRIAEGMVNVKVVVSAQSGYSTCVLPFSIQVPAGLAAYECHASKGDTLFLYPTDYFEAYTPYIIYAHEGFSATLGGMTSAAAYSQRVGDDGVARNGLLRGALCPQSVSHGYVLTQKGDTTLFLNANGTEYMVPAGRAWIETESESPALMMVEDGLQNIPEATAPTPAKSPTRIYDLNGRRLLVPQKGINIVGGKKVIQ